jgi:hypothetical protein
MRSALKRWQTTDEGRDRVFVSSLRGKLSDCSEGTPVTIIAGWFLTTLTPFHSSTEQVDEVHFLPPLSRAYLTEAFAMPDVNGFITTRLRLPGAQCLRMEVEGRQEVAQAAESRLDVA